MLITVSLPPSILEMLDVRLGIPKTKKVYMIYYLHNRFIIYIYLVIFVTAFDA